MRASRAGGFPPSLLQCPYCMADWKQITARIRRARGSRDPAGQLTLLFEKTSDAMVAFELGRRRCVRFLDLHSANGIDDHDRGN